MSWNQLKQSYLKRCAPALIITAFIAAIAIPIAITIGLNPPSVSTWTRIEIGAESSGNMTALSGQAVQISSAGKRIDETVDSFYFAARPIPVGGEIRAKVSDLGGSAAAGIMVRHLLTPDSPNVFFGLSSTGGLPYLSWRKTKRGQTDVLDLGNLINTGQNPLSATSWLRLIPESNTVYAYYSNNGSDWTPVAAIEFAMPLQVFAGAAVTSGDSATTTTSIFDDIRFAYSSGYRVEVTQQPGDATNVTTSGTWTTISATPEEAAIGGDYVADEGGAAAGKAPGTSMVFNPAISVTGTYEVYAHYSAGPDRADAVPVTVDYFDEAEVIAGYGSSDGGTDEWISSDFEEEYGADYYYQKITDYYTTYEHVWESWYYYDTSEEVTNEYDYYYPVNDPARSESFTLDETAGGGGVWIYLGAWFFDADQPTGNVISFGNNDDGLVTLDAIRLLGVSWPDTDGDGIADWFELLHEGTRTGMDPYGTYDADTLDNASEYSNQSDPSSDDSDGDMLMDDADISGTVPYLADSDGDGLDDGTEINGGVDVTDENNTTTQIFLSGIDWDEDDDLLPDGFEVGNSLNPQSETDGNADGDGDGLSRGMEWLLSTDHENPYSDTDGLDDGDEVLIYETDPLDPDTDDDGHYDDVEVSAGSDPLDPNSIPESSGATGGGVGGGGGPTDPIALPWVPTIGINQHPLDTDGDGYSDAEEAAAGTATDDPDAYPNPPVTDADGDRMDDDWEIANGFDPADPRDAGVDFDGDVNFGKFATFDFPNRVDSETRAAVQKIAGDFGYTFIERELLDQPYSGNHPGFSSAVTWYDRFFEYY